MGKYFSKFPAISYNGQIAKNLLTRTKLSQPVQDGGIPYYDFVLPEGKRFDTVSNDYYGNPDFTWLMYMANGIIDPYDGIYLSNEDFQKFVIKKYGSLHTARNTVWAWRENWENDTRSLNLGQYAVLPGALKKYWNGVSDNLYTEPFKYLRARNETVLNTNRIVQIRVEDPSIYVVGKETTGITSTGTYVALVDNVKDDIVTLKHIIGTISGTEYDKLEGEIFSTNLIPAIESVYWKPVSNFDRETSINESKRLIKLVNKQMAFQIEKDLKRKLNS